MSDRRFAFVQWEFPGRLGPPPGRYPVRRFAGDSVQEILVIGGAAAPVPRRRRGRGGPPAPVEATRATVIDATPLEGRVAAEAWLERAAGADADSVLEAALRLLNRAVAGHRLATADPYVPDADPRRALASRVGYGSGDQVAEGEWEAARELAVPPLSVSRALAPHERLAALLSGRDVALACEELALRARLDIDQGRGREGAMQAHLALEAAVAELESWREQGDMGRRLEDLGGRRGVLAAAANAALAGGLEPEAEEAVAEALGRVEAALRARASTV